MAGYLHASDGIIPPEEVAAGSVTNEMAQRWMQLQQLQVGGCAGAGRRQQQQQLLLPTPKQCGMLCHSGGAVEAWCLLAHQGPVRATTTSLVAAAVSGQHSHHPYILPCLLPVVCPLSCRRAMRPSSTV